MPMEANEALEQFKSGGNTEEVRSFKKTPILYLENEVGSFITGTLLKRKEVKTQWGQKKVYDLRVDSARTLAKVGDTIVAPKSGDLVTVFPKTELDRKLGNIEDNSSVYIQYSGRDKTRKNSPHMYRVITKKVKEAVEEMPF